MNQNLDYGEWDYLLIAACIVMALFADAIAYFILGV